MTWPRYRISRTVALIPRLQPLALAAAVALLAAACIPLAGADAQKVPTGSQMVEIDMREHAYRYEDPGLEPGRVTFRVTNHDDVDHDLALIQLPDDVRGVTEWRNRGESIGGVYPIYLMADRAPGETGVFAVDLPAGHYGMLCFVSDDDGTAHYKDGMVASFRVTESTGTR